MSETPITTIRVGDPCALDAQVLAIGPHGKRFRLSKVVEACTVSGRVKFRDGSERYARIELDLSRCSVEDVASQREWQDAREEALFLDPPGGLPERFPPNPGIVEFPAIENPE